MDRRHVFIDSCAFDALFKLQVDAGQARIKGFVLCITPTVRAELEDMPDKPEEPGKREFILALADGVDVEPMGFFGVDTSHSSGGFGSGYLADITQTEYMDETKGQLKAPRKSGRPKNSTDQELLAHSIFAAVLTAEKGIGNHILRTEAKNRGAKIININEFAADGDFGAFLEEQLRHG